MSDKQKSFTKLILIVLAVLGGGAAGDAAGYTPDTATLEKLGVLPAIGICVYLHRYWYPLVLEAVGHLRLLVDRSDKEETRRMARELESGVRPPEIENEQPAVAAAVATRKATHPGLKVIKPGKDY